MGHAVKKIDAKPLRDLIRVHGLNVSDISKQTDISASALYTWEREGKMPGYMGPVCYGLLAQIKRHTPAPGAKPETLIVRLPEGKDRETALRMLEAIGAKFKPVDEI